MKVVKKKVVKKKVAKKNFDCYTCEYKREIAGDCHIRCAHPTPRDINIVGHETGIRGGWFFYPYNFDVVWLKNCDGYKKK